MGRKGCSTHVPESSVCPTDDGANPSCWGWPRTRTRMPARGRPAWSETCTRTLRGITNDTGGPSLSPSGRVAWAARPSGRTAKAANSTNLPGRAPRITRWPSSTLPWPGIANPSMSSDVRASSTSTVLPSAGISPSPAVISQRSSLPTGSSMRVSSADGSMGTRWRPTISRLGHRSDVAYTRSSRVPDGSGTWVTPSASVAVMRGEGSKAPGQRGPGRGGEISITTCAPGIGMSPPASTTRTRCIVSGSSSTATTPAPGSFVAATAGPYPFAWTHSEHTPSGRRPRSAMPASSVVRTASRRGMALREEGP